MYPFTYINTEINNIIYKSIAIYYSQTQKIEMVNARLYELVSISDILIQIL